jgi:hypothetical protein
MLLILPAVACAGDAATCMAIDDHLGWGWQAQVLRNDLVTLAVVPAIGGRVMQYDLGEHPLIWVNPAELGRTYDPSAEAPWPNFGGYKSWVAPQGQWRRGNGGWPPPPTLDHGVYVASSEAGEGGRVVLTTVGPTEVFDAWQARGLSITRRFTLAPASTRVRVEQTIINHGDVPQQVANWDATQVPGSHAEAADHDNFWIYFPINPRSMFGQRGFFVLPLEGRAAAESQWKTWPGDQVAGVQYLRRQGKICADAVGGWAGYVDERDGYSYIKRFTVDVVPEPATHPEGGSTVQVSTAAHEPYLELEVLGPLVDLRPGQQTTFVVDWYATRLDGPLLKVTEAGASKQRLAATRNERGLQVSGTFGVFHQGTVDLIAMPATDAKGANAKPTALGSYYVTPLEPFRLDVEVIAPTTSSHLVLTMRDVEGGPLGELDRVAIPSGKR